MADGLALVGGMPRAIGIQMRNLAVGGRVLRIDAQIGLTVGLDCASSIGAAAFRRA